MRMCRLIGRLVRRLPQSIFQAARKGRLGRTALPLPCERVRGLVERELVSIHDVQAYNTNSYHCWDTGFTFLAPASRRNQTQVRSVASVTVGPTETPPTRNVRSCRPGGGNPFPVVVVSIRQVAWVRFSDEATRE